MTPRLHRCGDVSVARPGAVLTRRGARWRLRPHVVLVSRPRAPAGRFDDQKGLELDNDWVTTAR
jgi:hypothetical protein